ncbi:MAG: ABC transporter substrate-binding protein, partial [Bacteroidaceae bacterium]|nr:ABC transporter substrate-binding protein [Bacteroidaceae bacterium]
MRQLVRIFFNALLLCLIMLFAVSCNNADAEQIDGEKVDMRHSSLLEIFDCKGYTVANVKNPWGKGLLNRYLLVSSDSVLPENLPSGVVVRTPIERAVLFSGVHALLFEELGALSAVSGVCDSRHLYSPGVKKALSEGRVFDCGSSLNVN